MRRSALATSALLLGACGLRGVAPAQAQGGEPLESPVVAYRIDDHRYFEITPKANGLCTGRTLYFVDTAKNIRSQVVGWDNVMTRGKLIIDAANDEYLIGPVTRGGNTNCSSGGGACGSDKMPYSTDGGRTWQLVWSPGTTFDLMVSGSMAYQSHRNVDVVIQGLDLTLPKPKSHDWNYLDSGVSAGPRVAPSDTKVLCRLPSGSEVR